MPFLLSVFAFALWLVVCGLLGLVPHWYRSRLK